MYFLLLLNSTLLSVLVFQVSASAVLEDSEALFADMALRLEKTKAEVRGCGYRYQAVTLPVVVAAGVILLLVATIVLQ